MAVVKLKDVVMRIKDKIDKDNTDLEYYVGGEHIDSGEISITRKGRIEGSTIGPAFHMHFMPGDVLLMSRNPHLKKAGVVDFEGICSDVSYICRTRDENTLLQKYLPFIFQTDHFWQFVEENKKGGLPFFLNWSDFERYEFSLPSIEKQKELSDLLWAAQKSKLAYIDLLKQTDELVKSQFIEMFGEYRNKTITLTDVSMIGPQNGFYRKGAERDGFIPIVKMKQLFGNDSMSEASDCDLVSMTDKEIERFRLTENDLLFGRRSLVVEGAGKCRRVGFLKDTTVFESSMLRVSLNPELVRPRYVQSWFETNDGVEAITAIRTVTTIAGIKGSDLAKIEVPIAPLALQDEYLKLLEQSDKSKFELKKAIDNINELIRSLMQQSISE